jgi:hypothetical protein
LSGFQKYIAREIARRAGLIRVLSSMASGGDRILDEPAARAMAARHVAAEHRSRRVATRQSGKPSSVREALLAKLSEIAARARAPDVRNIDIPHITKSSATGRPVPTPAVPPPRQSEPEPVPEAGLIFGVFGGRVTGAERIPEEEFHTSLTWGSATTQNWRASIEHNQREAERRERQRQLRWIG